MMKSPVEASAVSKLAGEAMPEGGESWLRCLPLIEQRSEEEAKMAAKATGEGLGVKLLHKVKDLL